MRRGWLLLLLLAPSGAWASEPSVVLLDWQEGRFAAGAHLAVDGVNARAFPIEVDACHRRVLVDVLYAPEETALRVPGGEVAVLHVFRVELLRGGSVVAATTVRASGYGAALGVVPAGEYALRLTLTQGADVAWDLRARGWEVPAEPACLPPILVAEVELDPAGDAASWVELHNAGDAEADVSGWTVSGAAASTTLPAGTILAADARLVVPLPGLDGAGDQVEVARLGVATDRSPLLVDQADDGRSWHRGDPWTFAPATPGD